MHALEGPVAPYLEAEPGHPLHGAGFVADDTMDTEMQT